jgi:hypothetical protein
MLLSTLAYLLLGGTMLILVRPIACPRDTGILGLARALSTCALSFTFTCSPIRKIMHRRACALLGVHEAALDIKI